MCDAGNGAVPRRVVVVRGADTAPDEVAVGNVGAGREGGRGQLESVLRIGVGDEFDR